MSTTMDKEIKAKEPFIQWFTKRYPKIRQSIDDKTLGDNELWLYTAVKEAYAEGYAKGAADNRTDNTSEHGLNW